VDSLAILDFGSQYSQLIARRIREAHVYCELFPFDAAPEDVLAIHPKGLILSGGPASVYEPGAPRLPDYVSQSGLPVLGICYGMQLMTQALGGRVAGSTEREYGPAEVEVVQANSLLPAGRHRVWMSHGDRIESPPPGFEILATSPNSPVAAMIDRRRGWIGLQFHPEVRHTAIGPAVLEAFARDVCRAAPDWTPASILEDAVARVRSQVGEAGVLAGVSGGGLVAALSGLGFSASAIRDAIADTHLLEVWELDPARRALFGPEKIRARLRALVGDKTFADLKLPVVLVAVDLRAGREVHLASGRLDDAILATMAIPGLFTPVETGGMTLVFVLWRRRLIPLIGVHFIADLSTAFLTGVLPLLNR